MEWKGHFGNDWTEFNDSKDNSYASEYQNYPKDGYTMVSIPANYSSNAQLDFSAEVWIANMTWRNPNGGGWSGYVIADSGWSPIQTINLSDGSSVSAVSGLPSTNPMVSPSPTPASTPAVPELSWLVIVPLLLSLFAVVLVLRYRKTADLRH